MTDIEERQACAAWLRENVPVICERYGVSPADALSSVESRLRMGWWPTLPAWKRKRLVEHLALVTAAVTSKSVETRKRCRAMSLDAAIAYCSLEQGT